ncbi:MAG: virB5 [Alphaproteobacteria bacterium]|nr:MAG: virB5 [Caulobacteraceae bacterium]TPW01601.1 MAG: virB5 [Alphaproteobacteria bacterium]
MTKDAFTRSADRRRRRRVHSGVAVRTSLRRSAAAIACMAALAPMPAHAQMQVIDPSNLAQNIEQAAHALEQIRHQVATLAALTSHAGYGALSDGLEERTLRRYAPQSWEDALRVLESGGLPGAADSDGDDVAQAITALRESYAPLSDAELAAAPVSDEMRATHARAQAAGLLAEGVASAAFTQIQTRIGHVERMLETIDQAPDIKAAQDLQARITGEVALAQLELVRLEALGDALAAQDANRRTAAQARMQRFLNAPQPDAATAALAPRD